MGKINSFSELQDLMDKENFTKKSNIDNVESRITPAEISATREIHYSNSGKTKIVRVSLFFKGEITLRKRIVNEEIKNPSGDKRLDPTGSYQVDKNKFIEEISKFIKQIQEKIQNQRIFLEKAKGIVFPNRASLYDCFVGREKKETLFDNSTTENVSGGRKETVEFPNGKKFSVFYEFSYGREIPGIVESIINNKMFMIQTKPQTVISVVVEEKIISIQTDFEIIKIVAEDTFGARPYLVSEDNLQELVGKDIINIITSESDAREVFVYIETQDFSTFQVKGYNEDGGYYETNIAVKSVEFSKEVSVGGGSK